MSKKIIVKVLVEFSPDGDMIPRQITWPDFRMYLIDKVLDVRPAASKSGGNGMRYLCQIQKHEVPLYFGLDGHGRFDVWWCDGK